MLRVNMKSVIMNLREYQSAFLYGFLQKYLREIRQINSSMNLVDRAMDKKNSHRTMEFMVQESSTISKMVRRNERRGD